MVYTPSITFPYENEIFIFSNFIFLIFECPGALLPSERAAFCKASLTTGGLAEDGRAGTTDDDCLGMRKDGRNVEAAGALHVHEERPRSRDKGL